MSDYTLFNPAPALITPRTVWHVGVSGGKDSAAVLLWLVRESGIDPARINASFCDTGNEHRWTYQHVAMLSEKVHPIKTLYPERGYFELAMHKQRFPDRTDLPEWDFSGTLLCMSWRPLLRWTLKNVLEIHERHGVPLNPLYAAGARRVGCWPCIMSRKAEIRTISLRDPERIDQIRNAELNMEAVNGRFSSFFPRDKVPERFRSRPYIDKSGTPMNVCTIDDVVRWSLTGKNAKGSWEDEDVEELEPISCNSGFCE